MYILHPEIDITLLRDAAFRKVARASWSCGTAGALHIVTTNSVVACRFYILFPQIPVRGTPRSQMCYMSDPERVPKSTLNKSDAEAFKIKWLE